MPDTYFTAPPHWNWFIVPYFFIGGISGGCLFIAALLEWFGRPEDDRVARTGYYVATVGAILSGLLLIVDLDRPGRFWHMLFQSERVPALAFKSWSPISFGAWALLLFGLFATLAAVSALVGEGRLRLGRLDAIGDVDFRRVVAAIGAVFGFVLAGYTGILLAVTNRPIWADSTLLGLLFLVSGASTAAATLILLGRWRGGSPTTLAWLSRFDSWLLVLELVVLVLFILSLGRVAGAWLSGWGVLLLLGVVLAGILIPLALHYRPERFARWASRPGAVAAVLVLLGGFLLRFTMILASNAMTFFPFSHSS